jgi:hypothetical protein
VRLRIERLVIGFCLVGLGALWTLANLGRVDLLDALHTWWPVSLIFWGLLELFATLVLGPARSGE